MEEIIKSLLQEIGAAAYQLGYEIYIVGGYVRNKLYTEFYHKTPESKSLPEKLPDARHASSENAELTKTSMSSSRNEHNNADGTSQVGSKDIDLVINTNAIEFTHRLQRYMEDNHPQHHTFDIVEEFEQFGTIKIEHPDYAAYKIELASTRTESYQEPAAFPKVTIIDNIQDDLERRDFTINALLESINPSKAKYPFGEIVDHVNGLKDLEQGLIRVFHDDSFIDDPTRIYRAARFMAEYDFKIEEHTLTLMQQAASHKDFSQWHKKRKARFTIELENIEKLGTEKAAKAKSLLSNLNIQL